MIKTIIQLIVTSLILYYSFIEAISVVYWFTTIAYILVGTMLTVLAYGLDTKAIWLKPEEVLKLQSKITHPLKIVQSIATIVFITIVLIYTQNYYHLLFPLVLVGFLSSLHNYK